jgi:DNA-binding MarR family transcriptional regulator
MASRTVTREVRDEADVSGAGTIDPQVADGRLLDALEHVAVGMIGVTSAVFAGDPPIDLTLLQWRTLVVVTEADDGLRISEVASRTGTSLPSASRLVDRLVRRGLLIVEPDSSDRRARIVRSTRAGTTLRKRLVARRREMISQRVGRVMLPSELLSGLETIGQALDDRR